MSNLTPGYAAPSYQLQRPKQGKRLRALLGVENSLSKLGINETFASIWRDDSGNEDIIVHFCAESETDRMRLKSLMNSHKTQPPFKCVLMKKFPRLPNGSIDATCLPPPPSTGLQNDRRRQRLCGSSVLSHSPPPPALLSRNNSESWATVTNNQLANKDKYKSFKNSFNVRPSTVGTSSPSRSSGFPLLSPLSDQKVSMLRRNTTAVDSGANIREASLGTSSPYYNPNQYRQRSSNTDGAEMEKALPSMSDATAVNFKKTFQLSSSQASAGEGASTRGRNIQTNDIEEKVHSPYFKRWVVDAWTQQGPHHSNEDRWCCEDDLFAFMQNIKNSHSRRSSSSFSGGSGGGSDGTLIPGMLPRRSAKYAVSTKMSPYVRSSNLPASKLGIQPEIKRPSVSNGTNSGTWNDQFRFESGNSVSIGDKISLWACFDGHGGATAAEYCRINAPIEVIAALSAVYGEFIDPSNDRAQVDQANQAAENGTDSDGRKLLAVLEQAISRLESGFKRYSRGDDSGCCATLVLCKAGTVAIANLGDCQVMVYDSKLTNIVGGRVHQAVGGQSPDTRPSLKSSSKFGWKYKLRMGKKNNASSTGDSQSFRGSMNSPSSSSDSQSLPVVSYELTTPHRASDPSEVERILACGGTVVNGRVMGVLEPSRAIGDFDLKRMAKAKKAVGTTPSVCSVTILQPPSKQLTMNLDLLQASQPTDSPIHVTPKRRGSYGKATSFVPSYQPVPFIVIASDGVWDFLTVSEVGATVRKCHETIATQGDGITRGSFISSNMSIARRLVEEAKAAGSEDDITVLVVTFIE